MHAVHKMHNSSHSFHRVVTPPSNETSTIAAYPELRVKPPSAIKSFGSGDVGDGSGAAVEGSCYDMVVMEQSDAWLHSLLFVPALNQFRSWSCLAPPEPLSDGRLPFRLDTGGLAAAAGMLMGAVDAEADSGAEAGSAGSIAPSPADAWLTAGAAAACEQQQAWYHRAWLPSSAITKP